MLHICSNNFSALPGYCVRFSGIYTKFSSCSAAGSVIIQTFVDSACTVEKTSAIATETCAYHGGFQQRIMTACPCNPDHRAQCDTINSACEQQYPRADEKYQYCECTYAPYINCLRRSAGCLTPDILYFEKVSVVRNSRSAIVRQANTNSVWFRSTRAWRNVIRSNARGTQRRCILPTPISTDKSFLPRLSLSLPLYFSRSQPPPHSFWSYFNSNIALVHLIIPGRIKFLLLS